MPGILSRALALTAALVVPLSALTLQGDIKAEKKHVNKEGAKSHDVLEVAKVHDGLHKEGAKGHKEAAKGRKEGHKEHKEAAKGHKEGAKEHKEAAKGRKEGHKEHKEAAKGHEKALKKEAHKEAAKNRKERVEKLRKDKLFMPAKKHSGKAQTVTEDCNSWQGEGLHCETEFPEHALVRDWIPSDAVVMEFGARFGTTSCEIANKLNNSGNVIVVEPDLNVWDTLEGNLKSHNCNAHVLRGAVSSVDLHMSPKLNVKRGYSTRALDKGGVTVPGYSFSEVEAVLGKKVDTLLIDCEGCAQDMMDQLGPVLESGQIKLLIIEGDMPVGAKDCHSHCMDYDKFFNHLKAHGFKMVDKFNDCDRDRTGAPKGKWCGKWIDHFAFKRM